MENKKEDRRVRLTKQLIRDALVELMEDHPITKISVKMICEKADINRSTFYAHYTNQYDVLQKTQESVLDEFLGEVFETNLTQTSQLTVPILVKILRYAKENASLFKVLLSDKGNPKFKEALMEVARRKTLQEIEAERILDSRTNIYIETFAIAGYINIIDKWIEEGCVDEPEMLADLMTKLLFHGVLSVYR